jgi:hypothetical protein
LRSRSRTWKPIVVTNLVLGGFIRKSYSKKRTCPEPESPRQVLRGGIVLIRHARTDYLADKAGADHLARLGNPSIRISLRSWRQRGSAGAGGLGFGSRSSLFLRATGAAVAATTIAAAVTATIGTAATGVAAAVLRTAATRITAGVFATAAGIAALVLLLEQLAQEAGVLFLAAATAIAATIVTAAVVTAGVFTAATGVAAGVGAAATGVAAGVFTTTRFLTTTLRLARVASTATSQHGVQQTKSIALAC